jgi:hypothetical protein
MSFRKGGNVLENVRVVGTETEPCLNGRYMALSETDALAIGHRHTLSFSGVRNSKTPCGCQTRRVAGCHAFRSSLDGARRHTTRCGEHHLFHRPAVSKWQGEIHRKHNSHRNDLDELNAHALKLVSGQYCNQIAKCIHTCSNELEPTPPHYHR